jgi:hypothetical protein
MGLIIRYVSSNITDKVIPKPNIFTETGTQGSFRVCDLSPCNLLVKTNNFGLCTVLLSCLISELQKPSSPGLEPRAVFRGFDRYCFNLLVEMNIFGLGDVLLSYLVSKIQKPP